MKSFLALLLAAVLNLPIICCSCENSPKMEDQKMASTLSNTYYRLTVDKQLNVAFLGGSITQGGNASAYSKNYVSLTENWLNENFPDAEININNAGLSNTGSNYGIFRLREDILDVAVPDLIFIEFTSNDWGRFGDLNISRQNESIIRKLYEVNPKIDIMFLFTGFAYDSPCRRASTALAEHYGLTVIDPGKILKTRIDNEENGDYSKYSPDKIHPNDTGHAFYVEMIGEQLQKYLVDEKPQKAEYLDAYVPEPLNENGLFMSPEMISPVLLDYPASFEYKEGLVKMCRMQYDHYIETTRVGAELEFTFEGTGFGLLVYKSSSVSDISYSVDGGEFKPYAIGDMHNYNHGQMYIMEYDLERGEHTVRIRNEESKYGSTLRILKVCINK